MLTGIIVFITVLLFFVFFAFYKREMLIKFFTLDMKTPVNELKEQLESTADTIIKRLEDRISHLEYLLDEAEQKTAALESQIRAAEQQLDHRGDAAGPLSDIQTVSDIDTNIDYNIYSNTTTERQADEPTTTAKETQNNNKKQLILAMANQGYNATEISKATGIGKGEIMLFLQLNKR